MPITERLNFDAPRMEKMLGQLTVHTDIRMNRVVFAHKIVHSIIKAFDCSIYYLVKKVFSVRNICIIDYYYYYICVINGIIIKNG